VWAPMTAGVRSTWMIPPGRSVRVGNPELKAYPAWRELSEGR
jgi:hypothetical protein